MNRLKVQVSLLEYISSPSPATRREEVKQRQYF